MNALATMVKSRRITQKFLAEALGVSRAAVSLRIRDGIRNIRTARKYAKILDCNPLFLLDID